MGTDVLPEIHLSPQSSRPQPRGDQRSSSLVWRWNLGILGLGLLAAMAWAAARLPGVSRPRETGPVPTHTISREELLVTITEQGTLESSDNTEIKCRVRGESTVNWVIEGGTMVKPGDDLVRLDTLALEDAIAERTKFAHSTRSGAERFRADVARAELAIPEYLEGRYRSQMMTLEKDLAIAESGLLSAQNMLRHAEMMAQRGYVSELEIEDRKFAVTQAELLVKSKKLDIDVLSNFSKKMELETLNGNLKAAKAKLAAEEERAKMDAIRRDLAIEELQYCTIKAERSGMVIHPSAAQWKNVPEVEAGATVHMDQVLLLMPDLSKMHVKVGIHESVIERIKPGLEAKITLPDRSLDGKVKSVSSVTRPAGWWTGNVVKYDTIIELPSVGGLKPGMSAEVKLLIKRYEDVLTIPVTAVVQTATGDLCWIGTPQGLERRLLQLGDTDDTSVVVEGGLQEGEEVVINPLAYVEEAQFEVLKPHRDTEPTPSDAGKSVTASPPLPGPEVEHDD
ncbi:MAG: efflux RND transporter periplasmic adaptor subunit [Pirellulaceae bacterium]